MMSQAYNPIIQVRITSPESEKDLLGSLHIPSSGLPYFELGDAAYQNIEKAYQTISQQSRFECKSERHVYHLLDCDVPSLSSIYPRYIIEDVNSEKFEKIQVLLTGFSRWINATPKIEFKENSIIKGTSSEKFNEVIEWNSVKLKIEYSNYRKVVTNNTNTSILTEETYLQIEKVDGYITPAEADDLSNDLRILFSLITANSLSIEKIKVCADNTWGRFYTWHTKNESNSAIRIEEFAMNYHSIKEYLPKIFHNFFSPNLYCEVHEIWARLVGLFSFKENWEYEVLGYISVVDAYSKRITPSFPNDKKWSYLRRKLKNTVNSWASEKMLDDDKNIVSSILHSIRNYKVSPYPTFREKFEYLKKTIDPLILNAVDLTQEDFKQVKLVRDSISHGRKVKPNLYHDYTKEDILKSKVVVLSLSILFGKFGIPSFQIARYFRYSSNQTFRQARLKYVFLDKLSGRVPFLKITNTNGKSLIEKYKSHQIVIEKNQDSSFSINTDLCELINKNWEIDGVAFSDSKDYLREAANISSEKQIIYSGIGYLEIDKVDHHVSSLYQIK